MTVAAIVLTRNEEERIGDCLQHLKPYLDYILVLDGESTDNTVSIAEPLADKVLISSTAKNFGEARNFARSQVPKDYLWLLWVDADERFDRGFLENIANHIQGAEIIFVICFRFPRCNLPSGKDYPDYQVRLMRNSRDIQWRGKFHEVPYFEPRDAPLDQLDDLDNETQLGVVTLNQYPILHLARRTDDERSWW